MSYLQNEGKLNNEKLTVKERERNKKVVPKLLSFSFGVYSIHRFVRLF